MDGRKRAKKHTLPNQEIFTNAAEHGWAEDPAANSWFKQRLIHVRNETRKELRLRAIHIGRSVGSRENS